jgi:hypothetical protein
MTKMAEKVKVYRGEMGNIRAVEVLDRRGNVLAELPLLGVEYNQVATGPSEVKLTLAGSRVEFAAFESRSA